MQQMLHVLNVDGWIGDDGIEAFYQQMVVVNLLLQYHLKMPKMASSLEHC